MSASLDVFLAHMAAMLDGCTSARAVEVELGPSASGTARLALYATLVARQQQGVIDEFYAAVRVASGRRFVGYRDAYLRAHPPSHWAPARAAEHFAAFLEAQGAAAELIELADFAWVRHLVLHAPVNGDGSCLTVRHYSHAVRAFTQAVERGTAEGVGRPVPMPETWLMGRSLETAAFVVVEPSLAALVVVEVLSAGAWSVELPQLASGDLVNEAAHLERLGLLSAAAVTRFKALLP
jgi:hypothetical protein